MLGMLFAAFAAGAIVGGSAMGWAMQETQGGWDD